MDSIGQDLNLHDVISNNPTLPLVSICCVTYNHEKYIRDAIEGFLLQKTTFPFEIIIHDDASVDNTQDIIREYEHKYPVIIKPIYQIENQWSKGVKPLLNYIWPRTCGKYIALCEGDDYWTDPLKLQQQVDILEHNQLYSMVYHNMLFKNEMDNSLKLSDWPQKPELSIRDLAERNYIYTASAVFRKSAFNVNSMPSNLPFGDYFIWLMVAKSGLIKYIDEPMGVYRIHEGGIWSTMNYYTRQAKTLMGKKILISYFKNDEIEELLIQSYIDLAFTAFFKFIKERKFFSSFYFLLCILGIRKGWIFLVKKILSKLG